MKYLKKFNESSNEYYTPQKFAIVNSDDIGGDVLIYDENGTLIKRYKLEPFTEAEKAEIDNIMLSKFKAKKYENPWVALSLNYNYYKYFKNTRDDKEYSVLNHVENYRFTICKSEDEWYFIGIENVYSYKWLYYKCDQYEGLLKFFEDYEIDFLSN
jgi:hypothetical protein